MQTRGISAASAADVIKGTFVLKTAARSGDPAIRPKGMKFILAQNGAGIIAGEIASRSRKRIYSPLFLVNAVLTHLGLVTASHQSKEAHA